ncbi:unnamed protein product [Cochlearia groenlandica]
MENARPIPCRICENTFQNEHEFFSHLNDIHVTEMVTRFSFSLRENLRSIVCSYPNLNPNSPQVVVFRNHAFNHLKTFQHTLYQAAIEAETPTSQWIPVNNTNFGIGHYVQPQMQSQPIWRPRSPPQPPAQNFIGQLEEREWPENTILEDNDFVDTKLNL